MPAIEKGSTVLVTGANGFIGSHIIDQLLQLDYKVRGTVRTEAKGKWVQDYFDEKYGHGKLELVVVPDMSKKGAFDDAVKGCSGVAHVASNLSFSKNPNDVIPEVIAGVTHTLEAANNEPSVKRFVFTSSSTAATNPVPNKEFNIDASTWNQIAIDKAWAPPPYTEADRGWNVYGASKTQAEQEVWKYVNESKPHFECNTILPNANFGPILDKDQDASTAGWIRDIFTKGFAPQLEQIPPQWFVDVRDTARLHIAALIDPEIKDERIFAFAEPYNWNTILAIMRKVRPDGKVPEDLKDNSKDLSKVLPKPRAEQILKKNFGQDGFKGLEEAIKLNIQNL
ncbi:NAD(P)-binding protein [Aureobasidium pullulans]|uniref:NAD(P)-binding protein n=1 Tax=Aureobasidium pullulans TaxID=5580 RepID=A0A4S9VFK3_AURPU|nr:NAD(P)-binding protein [Aureobasidium pullulans]